MNSKLWDRVAQIVSEIGYKPGYDLEIDRDDDDTIFIQVICWRPDTYTGLMGWGRGGRGYPTDQMGDGEIIRMAFGLFMAYETHECREAFEWRERRVFGPHIDIKAQWEAAGHLENQP